MTFVTSAGTTFALSASAPATLNSAGYGALTYTTIGEITDLGEFPSRVYDIVTHRPLATRGEQKIKGNYALGSQTIVFAMDPSDTGQALIDTAVESDTVYSVKIQHPTLGTIYARALINGAPRNFGSDNNVVSRSVTLEYTMGSASDDGVVFVAA